MDETTPPPWDHCGLGAHERDPVGCRGIRAGSRPRCLAHLTGDGRREWLALLGPGADVDLRGTPVSGELLAELCSRLRPGDGAAPRFGSADFSGARFEEAGAPLSFRQAVFEGPVRFVDASFRAGREVFLDRARFEAEVWLDNARVEGVLRLRHAVFAAPVFLGPLVCSDTVDLTGAVFEGAARFRIAAPLVRCVNARFDGPASFQLRYARLALEGAHLQQPSTVMTSHHFAAPPEHVPARQRPVTVSVMSLREVDASMLLLSDVDLSGCLFAGTHHLDQLRLEGRWDMSAAPSGVRWHRGVPYWCTKRYVIEEERRWRAIRRRPASRHNWGDAPARDHDAPGLAALTTTYRQLRKAREDAKDEPGAADFYYGEMEMRRYSRGWRHAERWLLTLYWAASGYGLRASRALAWLAASMLATVLLMMAVGLPDTPARPYPAGSGLTGKQPPGLHRPLPERFTAERAGKAVDVVLNSVVFRSSGPRLTRAGGYLEKAARLVEPTLLGLAVLAVRSRLKRG
ncbi:pentapeptide repeat-containing protein [Streptomyces albus subsp. chlorinus]|uniref:pentapeptide repeat-containing protein n=1 Tax=Streptomyces albus TaxID=1888 RepID=UPI001571000B|nr:pentapeptide repeat-containing protein [Streptomyces albus]NSC24038.1 pentapeptide repeat-containing protein [Streptomyces albus subsp. chlorinus]